LRFPIAPDFPWAGLPLITLAFVLLAVGLPRAWGKPDVYPWKVSGSIVTTVPPVLTALFRPAVCASRWRGALRTGEEAAERTAKKLTK
jgi:hypothetical protein